MIIQEKLDLFEKKTKNRYRGSASIHKESELPLAVRMRPRTLEEFVGQGHILGDGKLLKRAIQADRITSLILYGPPGCGKTTLAYVVSNAAGSHFDRINATTSNVQEMRELIGRA